MQIWHCLHLESPTLTPCMMATLSQWIAADASAVEHVCVTFGSQNQLALAKRCGLEPTHVQPATRHSIGRFFRLRKLIREHGQPDAIIFWAVAGKNFGECLLKCPTYRVQSQAGQLQLHNAKAVHDPSDAIMLPHAQNADWLNSTATLALRQRWQITHPAHRVIALLSEPVQAGHTQDALVAMGIACKTISPHVQTPPAHRLLVHPLQHKRIEAQHLLDNFPGQWQLLQDAQLALPWAVLDGCDIGLCIGACGGGALAWAAAAGIPVVAEQTAENVAVIEALPDSLHANVQWFSQGKVRQAAHLLHQLLLKNGSLRNTIMTQSQCDTHTQQTCQALENKITAMNAYTSACGAV